MRPFLTKPKLQSWETRLWVLLASVVAALTWSSGVSAQTPPPPPEVWEAQVAFFSALPRRFPQKDIVAFERMVAEDVQVYRDDKLVHRTREDWVAELQSYQPTSPADPQGFSVHRDQYASLPDGGVSVREFTYPIAPEGKTIFYHPSFPIRHVSYHISGGKLVRVVYGPPLSPYNGLCQAVAKAEPVLRADSASECK